MRHPLAVQSCRLLILQAVARLLVRQPAGHLLGYEWDRCMQHAPTWFLSTNFAYC
ncbi:hypothetical protein CY34DRAFT_809491 [Suillus luteus UH-Slu-Lm8-n1]|uniref:Unplaced genomic scaffold CY34scaffold_269, whole genome shotgun sequence n=1 Tax=Suillus luteus UH-Slu-Lm8-n1 TaxID=930992 RepID=A0A0D0AJG7_9AGAM|nr:hypothetical protein CY34DRAFT_809491 [Suillus luteus UH-Slu-Lm8-n1]